MSALKKWFISFLHAFVLIAFTAFWMNTDFTYGDEQLLVKWSSIIKRLVLHIDKQPPKKDFIFINLAYDKALIPREDGIGNEVITDRAKLAALFSIIKKHQDAVKFTICDVFLKGISDQDSLLQSSITGIKNIVFPTHFADDGNLEKLAVNVPHAIADYRMANSGFMKFKLFQSDSLPTIPVFLYERISSHKFIKAKGLYFDNGKPSQNSIIIDYQLRPHEIFEQKQYPVVALSELLMLPEDVIVNDFLKGRMVVVGDFNNDVHNTVFGSTPGTLILLNIYLTLTNHQHLISIWWFLFLLAGYTVFSRMMLFPVVEKKQGHNGWFGPLLGSTMFLAVFSIVSYLLFGNHLQVLIIALYINLLRFIIFRQQKGWSKAHLKNWLLEMRSSYFNLK